jgi:hypothetical protein
MEANGFTFDMQVEAEIDLPTIREMKATRDYLVNQTLVTLVGKVDAIHGRTVTDHKFTGRYDPERFMGSIQWRVYLTVFDANEFVWNVFEGSEKEPRSYVIRHLHRLTMHRYPGMERDVLHEIGLFLEFARGHLPERFTPREPLAHEYLAAG